MVRHLSFLSLVVLILSSCSPAAYPKKFKLPESLPEVSGLYFAGPDSLWWLNDGGSAPELLLTDGQGNLKKTIEVAGTVNRDWEDLTADRQGNVYIGDFGNNLNARQDLCIYIYNLVANRLDSIRFQYADQAEFPPPSERANFDMEGFFWKDDSLHLFSKNRLWKGNYYTKHYVLPATPGTYTAVVRDSIFFKKRVVTGAAISPDQRRAALVAYWFKPFLGFIPVTRTSVFLFEDFEENQFLKGSLTKVKISKGLAPTQYESIDFESSDRLIIASEQNPLRKPKAKRIKLKKRGGA